MRGMRYSDEQVARVCHAAICELQAILEPAGSDSVMTGPMMHEPPERVQVAVAGVRNVRAGMDEPPERGQDADAVRETRTGLTPRQHHENWVRDMRRIGWERGPVRDPVARTHPNICDYGELSQGERDKDRLFLAIVTTLTLTDLLTC